MHVRRDPGQVVLCDTDAADLLHLFHATYTLHWHTQILAV